MDPSALSPVVNAELPYLMSLAQMYKQVDAPVGMLSLTSLPVATAALSTNSLGDTTYFRLEGQLRSVLRARDVLASQIAGALDAATFDGRGASLDDIAHWYCDSVALIDSMQILAALYGP